ncbi:cell wall protein PRY3 [Hyalella azteca]|uniref:Cell wall protein PRY3 n=2 Tax=Hyalella azteca TaxID=294128 RepID=A0A8B7PHM1_HYAAZ|nr:cell wall protein PRY3 [Hyalella azteca]
MLKLSAVVQLLSLLLYIQSVYSQQLQQYCTFSPQHTLCKTTGMGPACGRNVPVRGVTAADIATITNGHNKFRALVAQGRETRGRPGPQPPAGDMMEMTWDEELALIAQRHADQCLFEHECGDCRRVERFGVGQNLYMAFQSDASATINWDSALQTWYDEVDLVPNTSIDSYNFDPSTGHYTAMVWAGTSLVGCGFTMFEEGGWFKKLYTCNYGPTGNVMFTPMYRRGQPCSSCPLGTSCSLTHPGLCASNENPKGEAGGKSIGQNLATLESTSSTGSQIDGQGRSLIQSQPNINQLPTSPNNSANPTSEVASTKLTVNQVATTAANNQVDDAPAPAGILTNFVGLSTGIRGSQTLPPHPATLALQRQRARQGQVQEAGLSTVTQPALQSGKQPEIQIKNQSGIMDVLPPDTLNKFLVNVGRDSQIIKTDSLDSVREILSALPANSSPLVFFRSNMGTLRQLSDAGLLSAALQAAGQRRKIRSTMTPAIQRLESSSLDDTSPIDLTDETSSIDLTDETSSIDLTDETSRPAKALLSCQDAAAPCPVVALAGQWRHHTEGGYNVVRAELAQGEAGQLVLGRTLSPTSSSAICVALAHRFRGGAPTPRLAVSVWPLGQVLLQEDVASVAVPDEDGWQLTSVSFAPVRNSFMVVLTIEPNPADEPLEVSVRGFRVTEGIC